MNMNYSKVFELLNQDVEKEERNKMAEKAVHDNLYNKGFRDGLAVLDKIKAEIKGWYWQADKQALAKDPCVVDAMIDLFIRTIDEYKAESEG